MRKKTHTLAITVTFDKPCSQADAVHMVRDCIHGTIYPFHDRVGEGSIRAVKTLADERANEKRREKQESV